MYAAISLFCEFINIYFSYSHLTEGCCGTTYNYCYL